MNVSVVIPARNESDYIEHCLEALARQTILPLEVLIVDNNSTDDTAKKASNYSGVRVISEPKPGISLARNTGFDGARGEIIARCDIDSIVNEQWIEEIVAYFGSNPEVAAVTGPASFYDIPKFWRPLFDLIFIDGYVMITRVSTGGETLFGSNCALRKSAWEKVRAEVCTDDANMHEDIDLGQHMRRVGRLGYDPKMKVGISARPLWHPRKMFRRWQKGLNNFRRHREWGKNQP